ncbi:MAG: hypothetical protein ACXABD_20965 [Candidatus Thorarchaeota archaeon]|jgi:hypothetical protein
MDNITQLAKLAADYRTQKAQGTHGNYFRRLPMNRPAQPVAKPPAPAKKPGMSLEEIGTLRTKMPPMPARQPAKRPAPPMPARQPAKRPAPQMPDMRPVGNALRSAGSGIQSLMQKIQAYQKAQPKPQPTARSTGPIVYDRWGEM